MPYHYFRKVVKVVGWFGGDIPTSSKWFETKLPRILFGQGVLSQKMGSYNPKLTESFCRRNRGPIIISEKSKSWVLALGGSVVKGKLVHINQSQPLALPNNQQKH